MCRGQESEIRKQSSNFIRVLYIRTNTLGKGMTPSLTTGYGKIAGHAVAFICN